MNAELRGRRPEHVWVVPGGNDASASPTRWREGYVDAGYCDTYRDGRTGGVMARADVQRARAVVLLVLRRVFFVIQSMGYVAVDREMQTALHELPCSRHELEHEHQGDVRQQTTQGLFGYHDATHPASRRLRR